MRGIPDELRPAFTALEQAVFAGEDEDARRILARIFARRPSGRALELAQGFDRVLAGRAIVAGLDLRLACAREGDRWRIDLVARSALEESVELIPGPALLRIERTAVDRAGNERRAVEYRAFPGLSSLPLAPGEPLEVAIASEALALPRGALAARATYELELRSGAVRRGDRELPAMRLKVAPSEALELDRALPEEPAHADDLVRIARHGATSAASALEVAVRIPAAERGAALDRLDAIADEISEISLQKLVPALRWLAVDPEPGGAPEAWRAWLRGHRARRTAQTERPRLMLPPAR